MLTLNCTSCGAEVVFRSRSSVFAVCSFCKSTLVRKDMNLELLGKMADLQYDLTPIQLGTSGKHDGKSFDVIGRLKVSYSDGFWNEWYVLFNDGKTGWLAEAQGFLALCFTRENLEIPSARTMKPGLVVDLDPRGQTGSFQVEDIREVKCIYSEGELPVNAVQGRESLSVDLANSDGDFASIEYAKGEDRVFVGKYIDFDDFKFRDLRRIDGW